MGVDNATLARKYLTELWGKGDLRLADELADENIKIGDPMSPEPVYGHKALKERIEMMSKDFTDSSITIDEIVTAGDVVVVRDRWSGVRNKDFFGVPAKGKRMTCDAVEWIRIKDGKVVENYSYFDVYTMFQQIGALPPPDQFKPASKPETSAKTARA